MKYGEMITNILDGTFQKADKVASDIANSSTFQKYYKMIMPGKDFSAEVAKSYYAKSGIRSLATSVSGLYRNNYSEEVEAALLKAMRVEDFDKIARQYSLDADLVKRMKETFSNRLQAVIDNANKQTSIPKGTLNPLSMAKENVVTYFNNPNDSVKKARIGAAIGGYTLAATAVRHMSGGTLTRDQFGQKDIAGIPFI